MPLTARSGSGRIQMSCESVESESYGTDDSKESVSTNAYFVIQPEPFNPIAGIFCQFGTVTARKMPVYFVEGVSTGSTACG